MNALSHRKPVTVGLVPSISGHQLALWYAGRFETFAQRDKDWTCSAEFCKQSGNLRQSLQSTLLACILDTPAGLYMLLIVHQAMLLTATFAHVTTSIAVLVSYKIAKTLLHMPVGYKKAWTHHSGRP